MILLKNRDRNPSFKKGEYIEINDAGNYPMEISVDGVCEQETTSVSAGDEYDSPSPDYPQPISTIENSLKITSCNKNLFDKSTTNDGHYITEIGTIGNGANDMYTDYIPITTNTNYYLSGRKNWNNYCLYDKDKMFLERITGNVNGVINITNSLCRYIVINALITNKNTMQLEKGSIATPYEPYQGSSLNITILSNEFIGKINDTYKDTLKVEYNETDGQYHLVLNKMVDKVVLNGSENWVRSTETGYDQYWLSFNSIVTNSNKAKSNYFTYFNNTTKNGSIYIRKNTAQTADIIWLSFKYGTMNSTADLKNWLSTHNTEVYYVLANPYEVDLGIVDTLLSYDEITNIFTDSDLLPQINAKYYKDFEFDKILRSGYNIDEQEYEIAKKQMANGKRKRILSSYDDCIIKINLGLLDNKTYQEYKKQLDDGEFHYWSYKYNQYKKANFILTKPSITTEYAYDDDIGINDMEITLEKSSDIE